ncbi:MAG TPA: M20/M25/M40 family metallo-hydrolase [Vicinamibacteria bacterium]
MHRKLAAALAFAALIAPLAAAPAPEEPVDYVMVTRIRDEGFNNSKVMETLAQLTDVYGPRLTGSPQNKKAAEWARQEMESWGLANAHLESWGPFGRGWSLEKASVTLLSPVTGPVLAVPKAWTPGTDGPVRGKVKKVRLSTSADLDENKGKLAGLILLISSTRPLTAPDQAAFRRYTDAELTELAQFQLPTARPVAPSPAPGPQAGPTPPPFDRESVRERNRFQRKLTEFLAQEKVLATLEISDRDGGIVRVGGGGSRQKGENPGVPALVVAAEHFNRIHRLLDRKLDVEMEIDVKATFHDDDLNSYNVVAEIPGTDKRGEIVMVGAHLDSWHAGTGATDNAAGSATAMEAVRILKALDVKPKRTIRVGLWTGEEQGLLGSRAFVAQHFAARPEPTDPEERELPAFMRRSSGPLTLKPDHERFSVYFNLDNGTGTIRGVYTQQNAAAAPIFEAWLRPFQDLGATTVTNRNTGGTDHQSFDAVGLPGFQFIQDQADYSTRTHHTNMDVYDRLQRDDMMQASVVMASFAYHAAMRDGRFPRKPMPKDRPQPSPAASASPSPSPSPR